MLADPGCETLGAFDVEDDLGAGLAFQDVGSEEHDLAVGHDHRAVLGDNAKAVAVAVKGQAEFGIAGMDDAFQVLKVFRARWVWMVVGEVAVDF